MDIINFFGHVPLHSIKTVVPLGTSHVGVCLGRDYGTPTSDTRVLVLVGA